METKAEIKCYNKGCQQTFDPEQNNHGSCKYHPGPVYFHDAYKIWQCCNKKSTDFTTWLNYPGCTNGLHSSEKSDDLQRLQSITEIRPEKEEEVIVWNGLNQPDDRSVRGEIAQIAVEVTPSAAAALAKHLETDIQTVSDGSIPVGAACKNNACKSTYNGPASNAETCCYHSGTAIFHEGMKYWSCCNIKTTDFAAFLDQPGCTKGSHLWTKNELVSNVREDFFSRQGYIHINVYAKRSVGDQCHFESDGLVLRAKIVYDYGNHVTEKNYELFAAIVPSESKVIVSERKVEIILKQAVSASWPRLVYGLPTADADADE